MLKHLTVEAVKAIHREVFAAHGGFASFPYYFFLVAPIAWSRNGIDPLKQCR
jgi:hypothetical protein